MLAEAKLKQNTARSWISSFFNFGNDATSCESSNSICLTDEAVGIILASPAAPATPAEDEDEVEQIIRVAMIVTGAAGLVTSTIPSADVGAITGAWASMIYKIAEHHKTKVDKSLIAKVVASVLQSFGSYKTGSTVITAAINLLSCGSSIPATAALNSFLNIFFTYLVGNACDKIFETEGFEGAAKSIADQIFYTTIGDMTVENAKYVYNKFMR